MSSYLDKLNEPQRQAVLHTEGPLMIIAGAGSGKTRVLTYRIAHLIAEGVEPFNILALTFTNKAAKEMRERIEHVVGPRAKNLWMGTFHSVFAKILRFEADRLGYPSNFTIYDTDDSRNLIKAILKERNIDDKTYKPNQVHNRISSAKNSLIGPEAYAANAILREEDEIAQRPLIADIYKIYSERLRKAGAMDFDDLLFNTNVLFRDCPDVLNKYQHKFRYIMVDEYQDTNMSQYLITRRLASVNRNICVVGDDAQSIYAFRGADIQNILNFEKDWPDLQVIRLEQNYRSTKVIVGAANSVIAKNKKQLRKEVWTDNAEGATIELIKAASDQDEARMVATTIFEEKMRENWRNKHFAILYRTNAQSRTFEEALRKMNIKYRIIGGLSFYQRKEIKDLVAYLRLIVNPSDEEAFKRVINLPKRGIGDTTVARLVVLAEENGVSLWEVVGNIKAAFSGRTADAISGFADLIKAFMLSAEKSDAYVVAQQVARESGLLKELYEDKTPEGVSRYENVQELMNAIKEFVDNPDIEDHSLGAFLQNVSLLTDADNKDDSDDAVTMMTIHSAKGLEFKSVFVVGMEEDLFPSQNMLGAAEDLEEERRLFYVALTRAEQALHMSYALSRYKYGMLKPCEPSRFIDEVDPRYVRSSRKSNFVEEDGAARRPTRFVEQFGGGPGKKAAAPQVAKPAAAIVHTASANFRATDPRNMSIGNRVEHPKFGFGTITWLDTSTPDIRAKVDFEQGGERTLILTYAKLMVVG